MKPIALLLALGTVAFQSRPGNPRNQHHTGPERFTMRVVATALGNPWEITWGPAGYLWVLEHPGAILEFTYTQPSVRVQADR
jgi:glucose/arabinose dehydrogenase